METEANTDPWPGLILTARLIKSIKSLLGRTIYGNQKLLSISKSEGGQARSSSWRGELSPDSRGRDVPNPSLHVAPATRSLRTGETELKAPKLQGPVGRPRLDQHW